MEFEIEPHIGFGPVKLGMNRTEVDSVLGSEFHSGSHKNSDYYFKNSLQIEFENEEVNFIGISHSSSYTALYKGINIFDIEAEKLFELIASNEEDKHTYDSYEYLFPIQVITLWDADEQYDRIGSETRVIWAQVGIGSQNYLKAVS